MICLQPISEAGLTFNHIITIRLTANTELLYNFAKSNNVNLGEDFLKLFAHCIQNY